MASIFTPEGSRFVRMHNRWLTISARISGMMVAVMAVITVVDIIGRSAGWYSILGVYEVAQILMVWLAFIGCAYAHAMGSNIRVDSVSSHFSKKTQDILLIVSLVVGLLAFGAVFYTNLGFLKESIVEQEVIAGIPRPTPLWPAKFAVPFGVFFLLVQFILEIGRAVERIRGGCK